MLYNRKHKDAIYLLTTAKSNLEKSQNITMENKRYLRTNIPDIRPLPIIHESPINKENPTFWSLPNELVQLISVFANRIDSPVKFEVKKEVSTPIYSPHPMNQFIKAFPVLKPVVSSVYKDYHIVVRQETLATTNVHLENFEGKIQEGSSSMLNSCSTNRFPLSVFRYKAGLGLLFGVGHSPRAMHLNSSWTDVMQNYKLLKLTDVLGSPSSSFKYSKRLCLHTVIPDLWPDTHDDEEDTNSPNMFVCYNSFLSDYWLFAYPFTYSYYREFLRKSRLTLLDGLGVNIIKEHVGKFGDYLSNYVKMTAEQYRILNDYFRNIGDHDERKPQDPLEMLIEMRDIGFFEGVTQVGFSRDQAAEKVILELMEPVPLDTLRSVAAEKYGSKHRGPIRISDLLNADEFPLDDVLEERNSDSITGPVSVTLMTDSITSTEEYLAVDLMGPKPDLTGDLLKADDESFIEEKFTIILEDIKKMNLEGLLLNYKLRWVREIMECLQSHSDAPMFNSSHFKRIKTTKNGFEQIKNQMENPLSQLIRTLAGFKRHLEYKVNDTFKQYAQKINCALNKRYHHLLVLELKIGHNDSLDKLYHSELQHFEAFSKYVSDDAMKSSSDILSHSLSKCGTHLPSLKSILDELDKGMNKKRENTSDPENFGKLVQSLNAMLSLKGKTQDTMEDLEIILCYDSDDYMNRVTQREFFLAHFDSSFCNNNRLIPFLSEHNSGKVLCISGHGHIPMKTLNCGLKPVLV